MSIAIPTQPTRSTKPTQPSPQTTSFTILLWSAVFLSFGNKIYELVLPLLMYELTHSAVSMATMRTAEVLPNFFFAVVIGVIVDRVNKKHWVLSMVGLQCVLLLVLVALILSDTSFLWPYYFIGFLLMTFSYGYFNAQMSLTKLTVPEHQLTSANAKFSFVDTTVGIMGPALSGLVLMLAHLYEGLLLTALAFAICFVLLLRLQISQPEQSVTSQVRSSLWQDLREGWGAFRSNRLLVLMSLFIMGLNSTIAVVSTSIIFLSKDGLGLSNASLALTLSIGGVGGLLASLSIHRLRRRFGLGMLFGISALLSGISYAGMVLATSAYFLLLPLFLNGFAFTIYVICANTFRHEQTSAHYMGRISGITSMLYRAAMPVTMYCSGWMILWWGTESVLISSAAVNFFLFLMYIRTKLWGIK